MHYLRRDEDPPNIRVAKLILRELWETGADVARALRVWRPTSGIALAAAMVRYHWWLARGHNGLGYLRPLHLTRHGEDIYCATRANLSDLFVLREVFVHRIYAFPYERYTGPVGRILDLGSNAGFSPLFFSLEFPDAEVVCVEPAVANVEMIHKNAALNRLRWNVKHAAVARNTGETTLYSSGWWASCSTTPEVAHARAMAEHRPERVLGGSEQTVRAITVPRLLADLGWASVDLVKMDIEGAERDILLDGDTAWLDKVCVLVLDIHAKYVPRDEIVARLAEHGFKAAAETGAHSAVFLGPRAHGRRAATRSTHV